MTAEEKRLLENERRTKYWSRWGPYLSDRAWGTVREDYSPYGTAWDHFPHDHARSRAYRWNEDGLGGISDRHQRICFAVALWNERDPILKERLFGLTGNEGNHGEDVKECYFHLDSTPTHSYMKFLYKYPQAEYPYSWLVEENRRRGKLEPEFELVDTGIFNESRYFDVFVEYAKSSPEDILIEISVVNRGPDEAAVRLLPTIWFRNVWAWTGVQTKPVLRAMPPAANASVIKIEERHYGTRWLYADGDPELLFTDNETNARHLLNTDGTPYAKDGINDYVVNGRNDAVRDDKFGTKAAAHYRLTVAPGATATVRLRLSDLAPAAVAAGALGDDFAATLASRRSEADEFYDAVIPPATTDDERRVMRQAFAGLLWSKQYYHYIVREWLEGDPAKPPPPAERKQGRNHEWDHLFNSDVISMPDKWEFPWYAAWDLGFHCVVLALVDPEFAKEQLVLMLREWYMHPNGQLPAYEWALGDVNPPVHAWAAWRVYKIEEKRKGDGDRVFLERVFQKLLLNFTWWVNRKDAEGRNVFQGGFLGLDNIGVFDRGATLPTGGHLDQSDGTSWMAMYCLNMMAIAMELSDHEPAYEDMASKFWEHFLYIAHAMSHHGGDGISLWDAEDGFFYDVLHLPGDRHMPLKVRSMVGLIPLYAVETLEPRRLKRLVDFTRRLEWFIQHRPDLIANVACMKTGGRSERRLLSIVDRDQLVRILEVMLDENEFLSPYGIRAVSKVHEQHPYELEFDGMLYRVDYEPGESRTGLFGGNSNWRGPVWFPANFLIIEALQKYHHYYGPEFRVECPTGSGTMMTLWDVAAELSRRLSRIFLRDKDGRRPVFGAQEMFQSDPNWRDHVMFYEYFHGDTGHGVGASHQTGWTALVAKLIQQLAIHPGRQGSTDQPAAAANPTTATPAAAAVSRG